MREADLKTTPDDPRRSLQPGGNTWALILAAGQGTRLSSLTTTDEGFAVPKQFCSLRGGASLLEETLSRAETVATRGHIVTVVAAEHRRWWKAPLWTLPLPCNSRIPLRIGPLSAPRVVSFGARCPWMLRGHAGVPSD